MKEKSSFEGAALYGEEAGSVRVPGRAITDSRMIAPPSSDVGLFFTIKGHAGQHTLESTQKKEGE